MTEKVKVLKCPGCRKLIFADKTQMDEHWKSDHEKNVYTPPASSSTERGRIIGLKWHQQIRMMFLDYPEGTLIYSLILIVSIFIVSLFVSLR